MCFHMYIDVCAHACVYVHFCNIPPQVLKLASLAPPPPPPPNIEKLPTHMSQAAILGSPFETQNYFTFISYAKINTQVPHLIPDIPSGSDKTQ